MKTRIFTLIVSLFIATMAFAYDIEIDGIYYTLDNENKTAYVTCKNFNYNSYSGSIIIPETITYNNNIYYITSIGYNAFKNCSSLTSINIPNSVTSIGGYAFYNCSSLTSINIPNSVTSIGSSVFYNCSSLKSIELLGEITNIPIDVFYNCSSLTSITIPNGLTSIESRAFYGCSSLNEIRFNIDNLEEYINSGINKFCCDNVSSSAIRKLYKNGIEVTELIIPETITIIPNYTFYHCSDLTSVTIPNSVTSIGDATFYGCSSLTSITIPNSVTSIAHLTFAYCSSLTSITIPNSVTAIGDCAFYNCESLSLITVPNSVTTIGEGAFAYCSISSVQWNSTNCEDFPWTHNQYAHPYIFQGTTISSLIFGDNIKRIPAYICYDSNVESVIMPNSVTSIGESAFCGCSSLTSITISQNLTSIGAYAFDECPSLNEIRFNIDDLEEYINSGINKFCYDNVSSSTTRKLYKKGIEVTELIIPETITIIPNYTFYNCSDLTSVTIPNSVTSIGDRAFSSCESLTFVQWNAKNCQSFSSKHYIPFSGKNISSFTFGDSVEHIPAYLCYEMNKLTSITIPNSVTSIGEGAFNYCTGLTSIIMGHNVTSIGDCAFYKCDALTELKFNIDNLEGFVNRGINKLCYSAGISSAQRKLYKNGIEITELLIPETITTIPQYTFYKCKELSSVTIPNNVTSIERCAFYNCDKLRTLNIGSYVESIGSQAFDGCSAIYSINIDAIIPPIIESFTFYDVSRTAQIKVPCGSVDVYQASSYWNEFTNYIESPNTLTVNVNDANMGVAVITKQATCTDIVAQVQAQAKPGYKFVGWSDGFTENPHTVFVTEDMTITAEFIAEAPKYTITLNCDESKGSVSGAGTYESSTEATIEAIANKNYHFVQWSDGNTENPRTIVVTEDVELMAEFAKNQYEVNVMAGENGYATGSGTYDYGTEVTIEAIANDGYHFVQWSDGNTENPRTIVVTEEVELTAEFEEDDKTMDDNVDESSVIVYVQDGVIYIEGADADYNVFDASGRLIYSGRDAQLSLPRGVYMIAVGGEVEKVVL